LGRGLSDHDGEALIDEVTRRKPEARQFFRTPYLTDGRTLVWEYPRETLSGDQMDFVEVMEINDAGLTQKHRVYWAGAASRCCRRTPITPARPDRRRA
jgi:hypothetical protein